MPKLPVRNVSLTAEIVGQSVYFAGDSIECVVGLKKHKHETNLNDLTPWSVTGIVGRALGQYRIDDRNWSKLNINAPAMVSHEHLKPYANVNLEFDAEALFDSALGAHNHLVLCIPMKLTSETLDQHSIPTFHFKTELPKSIPPSVRGQLFKLAYKILFAVRLTNVNSTSQTYLLQLPFRVLPPSSIYHCLKPMLKSPESPTKNGVNPIISNPFWIANDEECDRLDNSISISHNATNTSHLSNQDPDNCSLKNIYPVKVAGQIRSSLSVATSGKLDESDMNSRPRSDHVFQTNEKILDDKSSMGLMHVMASSRPMNFVISSPRGLVGRVSFLRTLYCLGDVIRGYFDFVDASIPCLSCTLKLESEEQLMIYDPEPGVGLGTKDPNSENSSCLFISSLDGKGEPLVRNLKNIGSPVYTSWAETKLICLSQKWMSFSLPIPTTLTPQFHAISKSSVLALDYRWRMRVEFELPTDKEHELYSDATGTIADNGSDHHTWIFPYPIKSEKLAWDLPLQLVPCNTNTINPWPNTTIHHLDICDS